MKKMRKVVGVLLALVMAMGMTTNVFADGGYTITINNDAEGHTYEAYQIFTGDLKVEMDEETQEEIKTLSNIIWGNGLTDAGKTGSAKEVAASITTQDAAEAFAAAKAAYLQNPVESTYNGDGIYTITVDKPGYYLIKDKINSVPAGDAYTEYILTVVGNTSVIAKSDVTKVIKEVEDVNDSEKDSAEWGDSADYDIGDQVPFKLTATLGDNVSRFTTYKVSFNDTLSHGLTYNAEGGVKVTLDGQDVSGSFTVNHDNGNLTIACNDVKALGADDNSVIIAEYTALLNSGATVGGSGNLNTVDLTYSNDPNGEGTGTTPEDTVVVFTYKTVVNKIDENNAALPGAGFTLYKLNAASGEYEAVGQEVTGTELTTFEWNGVDDGVYKLVETTTPSGYNTIDPIEFTVDAEHNISGITKLDGGNHFTAEKSKGTLTANVVNEKGSILPSTGGMGTTLLYVIGGLMIIGAGATLVMKRRRA